MKRLIIKFLSFIFFFALSSLFLIAEADSVFLNYKSFIANDTVWTHLKSYQIIGIIQTDTDDSLEFVLQRIIPDTLRLQIKFSSQNYAITCITSQNGWIVDPTRQIFDPTDLHPEEIIHMKSNILNLFSFIDENLISHQTLHEISTNDSNLFGFRVIDNNKNEISYFISKTFKIDIIKEIKFKGSNFLFRLKPTEFFVYNGFTIPRKIQIIVNNTKKTNLIIQNIIFNPNLDNNLFYYIK